jgi:protein-tyrosine phosphatase
MRARPTHTAAGRPGVGLTEPGGPVLGGWAGGRGRWLACENVQVAWVELDGAVNVRDVGGMPTTDGGETVTGRLLRSDNLQDLTPADVTLLVEKLGLTTVVDLRSNFELAAEGPAPLDSVPGVLHAHHSIVPQVGDTSDVVAAALLARREADLRRYPGDRWCGHYLGYLEDRPAEVVDAMRSIARSPGTAIVHCAAGKDRTGVIVALALSVAGVTREAVVADYVATGERAEAVIGRLLTSPTYHDDVSSTPVESHIPRAGTMDAFLGEVDRLYGGPRNWLTEHGFTDEDQSLLYAKLRVSLSHQSPAQGPAARLGPERRAARNAAQDRHFVGRHMSHTTPSPPRRENPPR